MTTETDTAKSQARAQLDSVIAMVEALELDYDRLDELRDEKDTLTICSDNAAAIYDDLREDDDSTADEIEDARNTLTESENELSDWIAANDDELRELTEKAGECEDEDDARQRIEEDALSVEVRSAWHAPGSECEPTEWRIVLCTGGPHVEMRGELSAHGEPETVELYYQDWFTGLQRFPADSEECDAMLTYARCFFFGE